MPMLKVSKPLFNAKENQMGKGNNSQQKNVKKPKKDKAVKGGKK
jgi:hypothetical protein